MRVAVIGGGPAGMMAAITAAENGADVTLFEQNEKTGKKMYIAGKGRCNLTNDCSVRDFVANVVTNPKFVLGALHKFTPQDTMDFCQSRGLQLKVERGNRVFPASDKSSDVIKLFTQQLLRSGVKICLNEQISKVECQENGFLLTTITDIICFDRVIIATGGKSYSATGSCGGGYNFAKSLGHKVLPLRPALCRILCDGCKSLEGLTLKNVEVSLVDANGKTVASEFGEMLFTNNGVSGPAVLSLSSRINKTNLAGCKIAIDLKPALDEEKLDARVLRDFSERMNKDFANSLDQLLPERLRLYVAERCGIPLYKKVNQITAQERKKLVDTLKCLTFAKVSLDSIEYGIVTSGGVDVAEVSPSTMESKLVEGLYFAGEVLDVDALTGGFNIQIALSTGYVAGMSASKEW